MIESSLLINLFLLNFDRLTFAFNLQPTHWTMASTSKQNPDELAPNVDLASMLDIDKIIDSIPAERKGLRYTEGWDPTRLDEVC